MQVNSLIPTMNYRVNGTTFSTKKLRPLERTLPMTFKFLAVVILSVLVITMTVPMPLQALALALYGAVSLGWYAWNL